MVQGYIDYNHAVSTSKFVLNAHASQMGDSWPGPGGGERFAPQGRQLVVDIKDHCDDDDDCDDDM